MASTGYSGASIYVICSCGAGKNRSTVSSWFDVYPGDTIRTIRARYRQWLAENLPKFLRDSDIRDPDRCGDIKNWRCVIAPGII